MTPHPPQTPVISAALPAFRVTLVHSALPCFTFHFCSSPPPSLPSVTPPLLVRASLQVTVVVDWALLSRDIFSLLFSHG